MQESRVPDRSARSAPRRHASCWRCRPDQLAGLVRGCGAAQGGGQNVDLVAHERVDRRGAALVGDMQGGNLRDFFEEIFRLDMRAADDAGRTEIDRLALRRFHQFGEVLRRVLWIGDEPSGLEAAIAIVLKSSAVN